MKPILVVLCLLAVATAASAAVKVKIMGKVVSLNETILDGARRQYQTESFPGEASVLPKEIQARVMDLVGLNNSLDGVECERLKFVKVELFQKSKDLRFSGDTVVQGYFNEMWIFDSCGKEMHFQIAGTHKGQKLEKINVVQTNRVDLETGERLKHVLSF